VDFFHFGCGLFGVDESDAWHEILRALRINVRIIEHILATTVIVPAKGTCKMLSIRPAKADDVSVLNTLIHEFAEFERLPVAATESGLLRDGFSESPKFRVLLAEWDGQPAGYGFFFDYYSSFEGRPGLFLEDIYVRDQYRGKGIGRALLARVASIAKEQKC